MTEEVTVAIRADTTPFLAALRELEGLSDRFGTQLTGALKGAIISGKALDDVLRKLALNLAGMALSQGLKPLQGLASSFFSSILGGLTGILPFAKGGVPSMTPFAGGGVVSSPSFFPMGHGVGLMGEAGAEAILPLQRGADGRLGVGATSGAGPVSITFHVAAPDPAAFAKSEAQISIMLARAVSRGFRTV